MPLTIGSHPSSEPGALFITSDPSSWSVVQLATNRRALSTIFGATGSAITLCRSLQYQSQQPLQDFVVAEFVRPAVAIEYGFIELARDLES